MKKSFFPLLIILLLSNFWACQKDPLPLAEEEVNQVSSTILLIPEFEIEGEVQARFFNDQYIRNQNTYLVTGLENASSFRTDEAFVSFVQYLIDFQDDQENFIPQLADSVGYPLWSAIEVLDSILLIPWIKENSTLTEAVLVVKVEAGIYDFKLLLRNQIYNNILTENIHLNYTTELEVFLAFDHLLFEREDRLLQQALTIQAPAQGNFRCPANYYWTCAEWIVPFSEDGDGTIAADRSDPCGSLCNDCVLFVYIPEDCLGNHHPLGWGNTDGRTLPPSRGGESGYGGGSGNNNFPPANPKNWWEERNYPGLLNSILEDLELPEEEAFVAECLAGNFELQSAVATLLEGIDLTQGEARLSLQEALTTACTCDDFDDRGVEQCDELATFEGTLNWPILFRDRDGVSYFFWETCPDAFNPVGTGGLAYTFEIDRVWHLYQSDNSGIGEMRAEKMCIQVSRQDPQNGYTTMSKEKAKEKMAKAFDLARIWTFDTFEENPNINFRDVFKVKLRTSLASLAHFGGNPTVGFHPCQNVASTEYQFQPLWSGLCHGAWE